MICGLPVPLLVTVMVALRGPLAAGVNVTLNVHCAPGFTLLQVLAEIANSAGTLLLTPAMATAVPPLLLTVTTTGALADPTGCAPNVTDAGSTSWPPLTAPVPVPVALIACGLPAPSLVTVIVELRVPLAVGWNVIVMLQEAFAAIVVQLVDVMNSVGLLLVTLATLTGVAPALVTVTTCGAPDVPTVCEPRSTWEAMVSCAVPIPVIEIWVGAPPLRFTESVVERDPTVVGANATVMVHEALTAMVAPHVVPWILKLVLSALVTVTPVASSVPVLVMVMFLAADVVPTVCGENSNAGGVDCRFASAAGITEVEKPVPTGPGQLMEIDTPSVAGSRGTIATQIGRAHV